MKKNGQYQALCNRTLAAMIIVPAIPFVLVVAIGYYHFSGSLEETTISRMVRIVEDHKQMIESFLIERQSDLTFLADTYPIDNLTDETALRGVFKDLRAKSPAFNDIGVFNSSGLHLTYIGPYELTGKMYGDAEWFREVLARGLYVSDVFLGYRKIPHFIIAVVKKEAGKKWVIRATIDTSVFSDAVERIREGATGEAYLLNSRRRLQTIRRSGGDLMEKSMEAGLPEPGLKKVKTFVEADSAGERYLYAASWLESPEWLLVVRQQKAEAFDALSRLTRLVILVSLLGGVLIIVIAFQVTRMIVGRLEETDTEKKELGRQLVMAGRLAEIGEMSSGFAHEINNPLQIIKSELSLIDTVLGDLTAGCKPDESEDVDEIEDSLNQIRVQVDRCGSITQGLLKFARKKESSITAVELEAFLPSVTELVSAKAKVEGIDIRIETVPEGRNVMADPVHLEQVLVNLLNNAIYAIVEKNGSSGGEIVIRALGNGPDQMAIEVQDDGKGIRPENLEKIFTPFFTTKPVGQGTGLGLSICYGIISEMGGEMEAVSQPGHGATFRITLPAAA